MTGSKGLNDRSTAGFSLLEMLVVMAILALVLSIALPQLTRPSDSMRLQATARDLHGALMLTRAAAIARSADIALVIDVDKRTIESSIVPQKSFPPDITVQLKVAEPERATPTRGGFRFFSDGSSTGGDLILRLGDKEERLCVNWLTGQPRHGSEC
jgi:general secretion pathway protein H